MVLALPDFGDGHDGIDLLDRFPDRLGNPIEVAGRGRLDDERHGPSGRTLQERRVEGTLLETRCLAAVLEHADDLERRGVEFLWRNHPLANRVSIRPEEPARLGRAENRDRRRVRGVALVEVPSRHDGKAHRGEESRAGYVDPDLDGRAGRVRRAAFRRYRTAQGAVAAEGRRADKRQRFNPRHLLRLPEDVSIERVDTRRLIPEQTRIQTHREQSIGREARTERLARVGEASHEQAARDEHDHGDRQLRDNQHISQRQPSRALAAAALSGFERGNEIGAHRLPGRRRVRRRDRWPATTQAPSQAPGDRV